MWSHLDGTHLVVKFTSIVPTTASLLSESQGEKLSSDTSCWHSKSTQLKQVLPWQQGAREEKIKKYGMSILHKLNGVGTNNTIMHHLSTVVLFSVP